MRFGLFRPFNLQINVALLVLWAVIGAGVILIGIRSQEHNPPGGLLLLGVGLLGPGVLSLMALLRPALWEQIVDPEYDARKARKHLIGLCVLGLAGVAMVWSALGRLL
ncbi:MAG TPA: hypothetical protein VF414_09680 [Thermoanaerobaculia bacterium]